MEWTLGTLVLIVAYLRWQHLRLRREEDGSTPTGDAVRDGASAVAVGVLVVGGITVLVLVIGYLAWVGS